ncbi:MAG TPA: methyl-accepting chemotaxis protein, partial [Burkholderiaceae bacterium]
AAESLKVQAQQMVQAVAVFKLAQDVSSRPSDVRVPPVTPAAKVERRGPARAKNVIRPQFKAKTAAAAAPPAAVTPSPTGTDDWEAF